MACWLASGDVTASNKELWSDDSSSSPESLRVELSYLFIYLFNCQFSFENVFTLKFKFINLSFFASFDHLHFFPYFSSLFPLLSPWFALASFFQFFLPCHSHPFIFSSFNNLFFSPFYFLFFSFQSFWICSRCFSSSKSGSAALIALISLILSALVVFPIFIPIYLDH